MKLWRLGALWLCLLTQPVYGLTIVIGSPRFPRPVILISIGRGGGRVSEINFTVPITNIGDGTPITGNSPIRVLVSARAAPPNSRTVELVADSSNPLTNGRSSIPFTTVSWTSSDADIPSGTFNGGTQLLMSFLNSRIISSNHTFSYSNTEILEAGTYRGTVTYTLSMP